MLFAEVKPTFHSFSTRSLDDIRYPEKSHLIYLCIENISRLRYPCLYLFFRQCCLGGGTINSYSKDTKGFTLIELSIVLLIIGILAASTFAAFRPMIEGGRVRTTEANMNRIVDVMSAYIQRNHRIPCPADPDQSVVVQPFGMEVGSGAAGGNIGDCDDPVTEMVEGIVPFKTLGISIDEVRDGWHNFITYRVSPVFTRDTTAAGLLVHERCRVEDIWVVGGNNRNPAKARFCCPDTAVNPNTDLDIRDETNIVLWPFVRDITPPAGPPTPPWPYAAAGVSIANPNFDPTDDNVTALAIILLSHGKNGFGAFLADGTRITAGGMVVGDSEGENRNGDNIFVSRPRSMVLSGLYFDDFLIWRTQDQIYAETGAGSCAFP